jgi:hypothetical protein
MVILYWKNILGKKCSGRWGYPDPNRHISQRIQFRAYQLTGPISCSRPDPNECNQKLFASVFRRAVGDTLSDLRWWPRQGREAHKQKVLSRQTSSYWRYTGKPITRDTRYRRIHLRISLRKIGTGLVCRTWKLYFFLLKPVKSVILRVCMFHGIYLRCS